MRTSILLAFLACVLSFPARHSTLAQSDKQESPLVIEAIEVGDASGLTEIPTLMYKGAGVVFVVQRSSGRQLLLKSDGGRFEPVLLEDNKPVIADSITPTRSTDGSYFRVSGLRKGESGFVQWANGKARYFCNASKRVLTEAFVVCTNQAGDPVIISQWRNNDEDKRFVLLWSKDSNLETVKSPEGEDLFVTADNVRVGISGEVIVYRFGKKGDPAQAFSIEGGKLVAVEVQPPVVPEGVENNDQIRWFSLESVSIGFSYDVKLDKWSGWSARGNTAAWLTCADGSKAVFKTPTAFSFNGSNYVSEQFRLDSYSKETGRLLKVEGSTVKDVPWKSKEPQGSMYVHVSGNDCIIASGTKPEVTEHWAVHRLTDEGVVPVRDDAGDQLFLRSSGRLERLGKLLLSEFDQFGIHYYVIDGVRADRIWLKGFGGWPAIGERFSLVGNVLVCAWRKIDNDRRFGTDRLGTISAFGPNASELPLTSADGARLEGKRVEMWACGDCAFVLSEGKEFGSAKLFRVRAKNK